LRFSLKLTKFDFLLPEPSRLLLELRDLLLEFGLLGPRRLNISIHARYDLRNFGGNESLDLPLLGTGLQDARIAVAVELNEIADPSANLGLLRSQPRNRGIGHHLRKAAQRGRIAGRPLKGNEPRLAVDALGARLDQLRVQLRKRLRGNGRVLADRQTGFLAIRCHRPLGRLHLPLQLGQPVVEEFRRPLVRIQLGVELIADVEISRCFDDLFRLRRDGGIERHGDDIGTAARRNPEPRLQ
jgi:hypothetical protein